MNNPTIKRLLVAFAALMASLFLSVAGASAASADDSQWSAPVEVTEEPTPDTDEPVAPVEQPDAPADEPEPGSAPAPLSDSQW